MADSNVAVAEPSAPAPSLINEPPIKPPVPQEPENKLYPPEVKKPPEPTKVPEPAKPDDKNPPAPATEGTTVPKKEDIKAPSAEGQKPPIDYESLKLPDGSLLSEDELAEVKKVAKDGSLTLDEAQGVLEVKNDAVKSYLVRQQKALADLEVKWREEWKNHPDFGGENLEKNTEMAKRVYDRVTDSVLREWLDKTRFGSFPPVMAMFARIGRMMSEDTLKRGGTPGAPSEKSPEERLYGKSKST